MQSSSHSLDEIKKHARRPTRKRPVAFDYDVERLVACGLPEPVGDGSTRFVGHIGQYDANPGLDEYLSDSSPDTHLERHP